MEKTYTIRQANQEDQENLAEFISHQSRIHRHLDWRAPLDWIGSDLFYLLLKRDEIFSALSIPSDPPEVFWVRLFAVSNTINESFAWKILFSNMIDQFEALLSTRIVASVSLRDWFTRVLKKNDFSLHQHIVILQHNLEWTIPTHSLPEGMRIRNMVEQDLENVQMIDNASFEDIWLNSFTGLKNAFYQSAYSTVVELDNHVIGYQMSTQSPLNAHLARLAIQPAYQNQKIGYSLVKDLLTKFSHLGSPQVTVNTQSNNHASLALYKNLGFKLNKDSFPVFTFRI